MTPGQAAQTAAERANIEQGAASDPTASAFVTASAGSGKTKLLTDRLLRLMLAGTPPGRIQCLTFTKAAAAEMALRLQRRLGRWVTLDDDALAAELRALEVIPNPAALAAARALFADVLDVPGSMRIGTIHAFCQSLLRRFPLEAQLPPQFDLIDEADARLERDRAREAEFARADPALLARLAGLLTADQFAGKVGALASQAARLPHAIGGTAIGGTGIGGTGIGGTGIGGTGISGTGIDGMGRLPALRRALGARFASEAEAVAAGAQWDAAGIRRAAETMRDQGSAKVAERGGRLLAWLDLPPALRSEHWAEWGVEFFVKRGELRGAGAFVNPRLAERDPTIMAAIEAEAERILAVEGEIGAVRLAQASDDLLSLAAPILRGYAERKRLAGLLDYADLIERTEALLRDPGAAWVLFKLDGGIDHLLLDEVQDTAPDQWRIAHALSDEFFAGGRAARGADGRETARTFFAVGDPKQSIFSFQGADPSEFERSRDRMRRRVADAGETWRDVTLDVSFRSTAPVLQLVDAVFADEDATPGVQQAGGLRHIAARSGQAGRVELWPLAPRPEPAAREPWSVPELNQSRVSAPQVLANALAARLAAEVAGGMAAGDVLVLVRRREAFARALVRALKTAGVPVAGLDRIDLAAQSAVQDLLSLCDLLLLPTDDLSLACVLTSPLGGLDDDDLMRLTDGRTGALWGALRDRAGEAASWQAAWAMLAGLLARADHVPPHALLTAALGEFGGRARLLARLGPEAAEPVDELLRQALDYADAHPPSLQGFVHWMRRAGAEVKREAEGAGNAIRVMTCHGAKGLQARLVVLADTTGLPPEEDELHWLRDPATDREWPVWRPSAAYGCPALDAARLARAADRTAEYNRLLYVALTRAEDRLIVCGWAPSKLPERCWHALVQAGFDRLGAARVPFGPEWEGEARVIETAQTAASDRAAALKETAAAAAAGAALPAWAGAAPGWRPAPLGPEPALSRPLAPSRPEGVRLGPAPGGASPVGEAALAQRRRRGQVVHELLQHVPSLPVEARAAAAQARAAQLGEPAAADEALQVLGDPRLRDLFGPGSRAEQPLSGLVDGVVVSGVVDRLAILSGEVLLADYKTGRAPPDDPARAPALYLRQLAAYRAVLRGAVPDRPVRCMLVWTEGPAVMHVPDALLDQHAPGSGHP